MNALSKTSLLVLRLLAGWYFLYAGLVKVFDPEWSAQGYLLTAKTFPNFFARLAQPDLLPIMNFVNEWALTLLGVSLLLGIAVRLSSYLGMMLMMLYYFPVLQFPYIPPHNFLVDSHILDALTLFVLGSFSAGRIWGLEKKFSRLPLIEKIPGYKTWIG